MAKAIITSLHRLSLLLALIALPSSALAHQLDEYLQATIVSIEPGEIRLKINLTPGVAIVGKLLAQIDSDRDGEISKAECAAYAESLNRDLVVTLDGKSVEIKLAAIKLPEPDELRSGWGFIRAEFSIVPGSLAAGLHKLALENRHMPGMSAYLVNAAKPNSAAIEITAQKRNPNQSTGEIEFVVELPASALPTTNASRVVAPTVWIAAILAGTSSFAYSRRRAGQP